MSNPMLKLYRRIGIRGLFKKFFKAIKWERNNGSQLSLYKQFKYWKIGFKSTSYYIYEFNKNDTQKYISDVTVASLSEVNDKEIQGLLNDKLKFEKVAKSYVNVPKNLAVINKGEIEPINDLLSSDVRSLIKYCLNVNNLVLKPIEGNRGKGIVFLTKEDDSVLYNKKNVTLKMLSEKLKELDNYLVLEQIKQGEYSANIFPDSANTVRLLIMRNPSNDFEPFIASAVHRFGSTNTVPADNWSRGGLSAPINLKDGKLGVGVMHPKNTGWKLEKYDKHPLSDQQISGVIVPYWDEIKTASLELTKQLNIRYVGWDILITKKGFYFIEGNCNSDLDLLQVHEPLLKKNEVVNFMKYYKYI